MSCTTMIGQNARHLNHIVGLGHEATIKDGQTPLHVCASVFHHRLLLVGLHHVALVEKGTFVQPSKPFIPVRITNRDQCQASVPVHAARTLVLVHLGVLVPVHGMNRDQWSAEHFSPGSEHKTGLKKFGNSLPRQEKGPKSCCGRRKSTPPRIAF